MERGRNTISPPTSAFSSSGLPLSSATPSTRADHDRPPPLLAHSHTGPHHLHPNRPVGRQPRAPIQREPQHYPMADRCMCSTCHLSAKLFPRTDDGRILLPVVPVNRSGSSHPDGRTHSGSAVYVGEGGDLVQYMLAPGDEYSRHHRPLDSSTATSNTTLTAGTHGSCLNSQTRHHQVTSQPATTRSASGTHSKQLDYPDARMRSSDDHPVRQADGNGDTEMKSLNPATLIGPGVSGAYPHPIQHPLLGSPHAQSVSRHRPNTSLSHHSSSLPQQRRPDESSHRNTREYDPTDHERVVHVSVNAARPPSGSYTGPPLPPHPGVVPMASLTINPSAGRGRPKGKAKAKAPSGDDSSEGGSSARGSPPTVASNPSSGDFSGQAELAPCKPRRGRPPRHEVVPGMGEFTVFL
ncbi:hypothetical protein AN958_12439 [Leucoagaricus sp. SymC.cos]|nr:hypothetical protein AN958_12439 [Leucoagaricus sp. SymC.cos]